MKTSVGGLLRPLLEGIALDTQHAGMAPKLRMYLWVWPTR